MCLPLKNACETSWCLIVDRWSSNRSDSVIVIIVVVVSLIIDDHVVQDDTSTHDQPESALRVSRPGMASTLYLFFSRPKVWMTILPAGTGICGYPTRLVRIWARNFTRG
jgi:hypothetical protein